MRKKLIISIVLGLITGVVAFFQSSIGRAVWDPTKGLINALITFIIVGLITYLIYTIIEKKLS